MRHLHVVSSSEKRSGISLAAIGRDYGLGPAAATRLAIAGSVWRPAGRLTIPTEHDGAWRRLSTVAGAVLFSTALVALAMFTLP